MKILKEWRSEGLRFQTIADLIGVSVGHVQNVVKGRASLGEDFQKKVFEINRLIELIRGEPADVILLKYELQTITGIPVEVLESIVYRKIDSKPLDKRFKLSKNLSMLTLKTLHRIRENGYESLSRPSYYFDRDLVDIEIEKRELKKIDEKTRRIEAGL